MRARTLLKGELMIESLGRPGYASKAFIYAMVGGLAAAAALNQAGGRVTDTSGALRVILQQRFGSFLLILLAVGVCGYAGWRVLDAVRDPERNGTGRAGLLNAGGASSAAWFTEVWGSRLDQAIHARCRRIRAVT